MDYTFGARGRKVLLMLNNIASSGLGAAAKINPWMLAASIVGGGLSGGISAFQNSAAAQREALALQPMKARLLDEYSNLLKPADLTRLIEGSSRNLSRSLAGSRADSFARGTSGVNSAGVFSSGLQQSNENNIAAQVAAQLAQVRLDEEFRRTQLRNQIASNPVLGAPDPSSINPIADGFLGGLTGAIGSGLSNFSNQSQAGQVDAQTQALLALIQGRQQPQGASVVAPQTESFGVQAQPLAVNSQQPSYGMLPPILGAQQQAVTPEYVNYLGNSNLTPFFTR